MLPRRMKTEYGKYRIMKYLFLEYPSCSTCRNARKWLDAHGVDYTARHIAENRPDEAELKDWIARSGLPVKSFFNTGGLVYKSLQLKDRLPQMSGEEQIRLLASDGKLVKRPLLVADGQVLAGFKQEEWEKRVKSSLIVPLPAPSDAEYDNLTEVWEKSVRATHHFLTEADIQYFKPLVRSEYLGSVRLFGIRNPEGRIIAFMGVDGIKLEMLFVLPEMRGYGYGKALLQHATGELRVTEVDVNEQNPQAAGFYLHCGFSIASRDACDGAGRPFPILHLRRD